MKLKEKILTILFLGIILFSCQKSEKKDDLIVYLKENGKSPTDYVIDKFNAHDYVRNNFVQHTLYEVIRENKAKLCQPSATNCRADSF